MTRCPLVLALITLAAPLAAQPVVQDRAACWVDPTSNTLELIAGRDQICLTVKLRHVTTIVLPEGEQIMDVSVGDPGLWKVISWRNSQSLTAKNIFYVKPVTETKPDFKMETNLSIVSTSGHLYAFKFREKNVALPHLQVYISADPNADVPASQKFVEAGQLDTLRQQVDALTAQLTADRQRAEEQLAVAKVTAQAELRCGDYEAKGGGPIPNVKPFLITSICHNGQFTWLRTTAPTKFSVYERIEGKPSILQFSQEGDTYTFPKVLDQAYVALGSKTFEFALKPGAGN